MDDEAKELLRELVQWQRMAHSEDVKDRLENILSSEDQETEDAKKIAYELTDGSNSSRDIAEYVPVSHVTVSNWQKKWARQGLVSRPSKQSSYKHLISLDELGIDVPEIEG